MKHKTSANKMCDAGRAFLLILCFVLSVTACGERRDIKIGFLGCLSGKPSDLGVNGRNGLMLAVRDVNAAGGINGRTVRVLVKDDKGDAGTALKMLDELHEAGVSVIIGPMTSTIAEVVVGEAEKKGMLLMSPSATTDDLAGKDDCFFRIQPANAEETDTIGAYMKKRYGKIRVTVVLDEANDKYTEDWFRGLTGSLAGSDINAAAFRYDSRTRPSYYEMSQKILATKADCVVLVTDAMDAALICQQLGKLRFSGDIISSIWGKTREFLENSGKYGSGVLFFQHYDEEYQGEKYRKFRDMFRANYGYSPDYSAISSYEAALVLFEFMEKRMVYDGCGIRDGLPEYGNFDMLQGSLHFSIHGDPVYDAEGVRTLVEVRDGKYVKAGNL